MIYLSLNSGITDTLKSLNAIDNFCKFIGIDHVINLSDMNTKFYKTKEDAIRLVNLLVRYRIPRVEIELDRVFELDLVKLAIDNSFDINIIKSKLLSILKTKKAIKILKIHHGEGLYVSQHAMYFKMGIPFKYRVDIVRPLDTTKHYDVVVNFRVGDLAMINYNGKLYGCRHSNRFKIKDICFDMLDKFENFYRNFIPVKAFKDDLIEIKEKYKDKRILVLTDGYNTMPLGLPEGNDFDLKKYENDQFQYIKDIGMELKISDLSANDVYESILYIANADIVYYSFPTFPRKVQKIYRRKSELIDMSEHKTQNQFKHLY